MCMYLSQPKYVSKIIAVTGKQTVKIWWVCKNQANDACMHVVLDELLRFNCLGVIYILREGGFRITKCLIGERETHIENLLKNWVEIEWKALEPKINSFIFGAWN